MEPLNCPFCDTKPRFKRGLKTSCQLHGEPMQGIVVYCWEHECHAKPSVEAGDIFNGGDEKAKAKAINKWNKRA